MLSHLIFLTALLLVSNAQTHGEGAEGSEMGPVAFLWPADRVWDATHDNTAPCGTAAGPSNRTTFPLSQGSIALNIADDAYFVAFKLAIGNNPTTQADFSNQIVANTTNIDPGHQCYKLNALQSLSAGQNGTIQLEYWSDYEGENNGNNQSFFACADITFVEARDFTLQVPCFNVTSDDFVAPSPTNFNIPANTGQFLSPSAGASGGGSGGLSTGAKAGIAVGAVIASLALFGLIGFLFWRRGKKAGLKGKNEYELRAKKLETLEGARG